VGHMPKRARARQALLPDDARIAARRRALPNFDPYDSGQLRADADALEQAARDNGEHLTGDEAIGRALYRLQSKQLYELLQAMGVDLRSPNLWRDAFVRLAEIHHNVGRLIYRWTPGKKKNMKSSLNKVAKSVALVREVGEIVSAGVSEREAIRRLAKKRVGTVGNQNSKALQEKEIALERAYFRAKREIVSVKDEFSKLPPPPVGPRGFLSLSEFEMMLFGIEHGQSKRGADN
jgi:hypothetical protein